MTDMDTLLTEYLDAEEATARGDYCPGCGAAWSLVSDSRWARLSAEYTRRPRPLQLQHLLECPFRQAFAYGNLGRLTGEVLNAIQGYSDSMNDPITKAYGCGDDMSSLFWASAKRRVNEVLRRYGLSWDAYLYLLDDRTSPRWVYESGLNALTAEELERD